MRFVKYTSEQMERLKKYEKPLKTAYQARYARFMNGEELDEIAAVWGEAIGDKDFKFNSTCPVCVINFLNDVATPYFRQLKEKEEKKKSEVAEETEPDTVKGSTSKDKNKKPVKRATKKDK